MNGYFNGVGNWVRWSIGTAITIASLIASAHIAWLVSTAQDISSMRTEIVHIRELAQQAFTVGVDNNNRLRGVETDVAILKSRGRP